MTNVDTPIVTQMRIYPVAGYDSMLLSLSGAHAPFFTRNIVILKDNAGHTGIGEVHGGEAITKSLEDAVPFVVGQPVCKYKTIVAKLKSSHNERTKNSDGIQNLDLTKLKDVVHA
ncbi:MAG: glucarate dehydratase, partial [Treponema socranskii subsp. buccale]